MKETQILSRGQQLGDRVLGPMAKVGVPIPGQVPVVQPGPKQTMQHLCNVMPIDDGSTWFVEVSELTEGVKLALASGAHFEPHLEIIREDLVDGTRIIREARLLAISLNL